MLYVDLELNGFIIEVFDDEKQAEKKMEELWQFIESLYKFPLGEQVKKIKSISQKNYKITEENRYETCSLKCQSNGFHTAGIVKIDNVFTIEAYLKERE